MLKRYAIFRIIDTLRQERIRRTPLLFNLLCIYGRALLFITIRARPQVRGKLDKQGCFVTSRHLPHQTGKLRKP